MNVAELEQMAINLNSEYDRDRVEAWEYFCDIAPYLVRRVIAAEKLVDSGRAMADAAEHGHVSSTLVTEWDNAEMAYEAAK